MRRPIRPFQVAYKNAPRRRAPLPASAPFAPAPIEPDGDQPFLPDLPGPGAVARRDIWADNTSAYEAALRAADAVFGAKTAPPVLASAPPADLAPEPPAFVPSFEPPVKPTGRILEALDQPPPILDPTPARRGRPKGAPKPRYKVKPRRQPPAAPAAVVEPPLLTGNWRVKARVGEPIRHAGVGLRDKWVTRQALPPGQRWRRRLPKEAWH